MVIKYISDVNADSHLSFTCHSWSTLFSLIPRQSQTVLRQLSLRASVGEMKFSAYCVYRMQMLQLPPNKTLWTKSFHS